MIRATYLSSSFVPSIEANSVHVMKMCQGFSKLGIQITLVARAGTLQEDPTSYYGINYPFQIRTLKVYGERIRFATLLYGILASLIAIRQSNLDFVFARNRWAAFFYLLLGRAPLVFETHNPPKKGLQASLERYIFSHSRTFAFVCISDALQKIYQNQFSDFPNSKCLVLHDAADEIDNPTSPSKLELNCLYTGSLQKGRGIEILIELARRLPSHRFVIAGGSEKDLKYWKSESQNTGNIHWTGHLSQPELLKKFRDADILLAPYQRTTSTIDWASPMKIFEYMAANRPMICSDFPVFREVLKHRENAVLVGPNSIEEWQNAVVELENSDLRQRLATQAKADFLRSFQWVERARSILEFLKIAK